MAFGTSGVTGPAQTSSSNLIPELDPANPMAGSPAKLTPMPVDTVMRSDAPTNPNAYLDAIAKFAGGSDEPAHTASATTHAVTAPAPTVRAPHTATTHPATTHPATTAPRATGHVQATTQTPATTFTKVTSVSSTDHSAKPNQSVADMSLAAKVSATARAGIASAAKDAEGSLKTALSDPKTQATLAGAAAVVAGAQFVPGLDVAVDATLGAAGVGMYLSAGSEHQANITQAYGKLKDYVGEVGSAKTQADLDKASKSFADFVKLGGSEAIDAAATLGGGAVAAGKVAGAVEPAGGIECVVAGA